MARVTKVTLVPRNGDLLSPAEVGKLFAVDAKTVSRWARDGRLPSIRTPGGHRRYRPADVEAYLNREGM